VTPQFCSAVHDPIRMPTSLIHQLGGTPRLRQSYLFVCLFVCLFVWGFVCRGSRDVQGFRESHFVRSINRKIEGGSDGAANFAYLAAFYKIAPRSYPQCPSRSTPV